MSPEIVFPARGRAIWPLIAVLFALTPVWRAFSTTEIFFLRDLGAYFWPHHLWLRRMLAEGRLPIWDPNPGFGYAPLADPNLQLLFLPSLPLRLLLPEALGFNLAIALPFALAALGAYLFLKRRHSGPAAALGGAAFALTGIMASSGNLPNLTATAALLGWVLWSVERLCERPSVGRVAALAAMFALGLCAGEPLTLAGEAAVAVLFAAVACEQGRWWRRVILVLGAGGIAALLSAVQLLPLVEATRRSIRGHGFLGDAWPLHPLRLLEAVFPFFFGSPVDVAAHVSPWMLVLSGGAPLVGSIYLGAALLSLAAASVGTESRRRAGFWVVVAMIGTIAAFGSHLPLYEALREAAAPLRSVRYPSKLMVFPSFAIVALAAAGLDALLARTRRARLAATAVAFAIAGSALLVLVVVLGSPSAFVELAARIAGGAGVVDPVTAGGWLERSAPPVAARALAVAAAAGMLALASSKRTVLATGLLGALGLVDLASAAVSLNPTIDARVFAMPEWVARTREHPEDRVFVVQDLVIGNTGLDVDERPEIAVPLAESPARYRALFGAAVPLFMTQWNVREALSSELTGLRPVEYLWTLQMFEESDRETKFRFLRETGVRYCLLPRPPASQHRVLMSLDGLEPLALYELEHPGPRAFVVARGFVEPDLKRQIATIFDARFSLHAVAMVDREAEAAGEADAGADPSARILREEPAEIEIEATAPDGGGYLLLLDAFDPHWRAEVDSQQAEVLRANGYFRAVRLAPGRHLVRIHYAPRPLWIGAAISAATALGLAVAAVLARMRWRPH